MKTGLQRAAVGCVMVLVTMLLPLAAFAQNFKVTFVAKGLEYPWSMSFAPDGRLYFTERGGKLTRLDPKSGAVTPIAGLPKPRAQGEAGTLGMALDPGFAENGLLYICYSTRDANANPSNRLSRFKLDGTKLTDETVLFDNMPGASYHNGCRVIAAPDGQHLFFSMGDAGKAGGAQRLDYRGGKIFRLNLDGSVPADNPFKGSPVWSFGHRNPQGLRFRPGTDQLWSTEHGPDTQDELNLIVKGGNYGWPTCRGTDACSDIENYHAAKAEFDHDDTVATSDLIFTGGDTILFVTLKTGRLYRITLDGDTVAKSEILIDNQYGRLRDIAQGPDGAIYIATDNGEDSILRLSLQ